MPRTRSRSSETTTPSQPPPPISICCPVANCDALLPLKKASLIQDHLLRHHTPAERSRVPKSFYTRASVHKCHLCKPPTISLFTTQTRLQSHIRAKHKSATRSVVNSDLLLTHFPADTLNHHSAPLNWKRSLIYFHKLDVVPFTFRKSIYMNLDRKTKYEMQNLAYKIYFVTQTAILPHINARNLHHPTYETHSSPLWKITLLLEGILLAPPGLGEPRNYQKLIKQRVTQFRLGNLDHMHRLAMQYKATPSYTTPSDKRRSQQIITAANADNWRKASNLLRDPLPSVPYSASNVPKILDLHPPPCSYTPSHPPQRPTSMFHASTFHDSDDLIRTRLGNQDLLLQTLRKLARDTASGPLADSTDFVRDVFLKRSFTPDRKDAQFANIDTLQSLLHCIYTGNVPKDIQPIIAFNESVAFYKDATDTTAIRPIGIGTAWRRIASAHAIMVSKDRIATFLAPSQLAIGLNAGMDIITTTMQVHADRYLSHTATPTNKPSRAILLLDMVNMFNSVSMVRAREIILQKFPHLLPLFDILYFHESKCWYRNEKGERNSFARMEGSSQGCPFAALLACLVLHDVLAPIHIQLQQRAKNRKQSQGPDDDGQGSLAIIMSYIDDCTLSIPYQDLKWFMDEFNRRGSPVGCILKPKKCKMLTSICNSSPLQYLEDDIQRDVNYVLETFCDGKEKGEVLDGIRVLGVPIGNKRFVGTYQNKTIQKLRSAISSIHKLLHNDPHIATSLYKYSLQHYTSHLLANDILHHDNITSQYKTYQTQFTSTINAITQTFLAHMVSDPDAESPSLPMHAWCIASTPTGMGGLGFNDSHTRTLKAHTVPFARVIRAAIHGMLPQRIQTPSIEESPAEAIHLPNSIKATFRSWKTSNLRIFQKYRDLTHQYTQNVSIPAPKQTNNTLIDFTLHTPLHLTTKTIQREILNHRMKSIWPNLDDSIKKHLPSTMSTLTSTPLMNVSRTDPTNRLSYDEFKIYCQRKMRLPLWPSTPTCICGQMVDPYGDHFFTCQKTSKKDLHDRIRNSLYAICKHTFPIISSSTHEDTLLEEPFLFDLAPQMRPGDVVVRHPIATNVEPHRATLIDVTIIPPYEEHKTSLSFQNIISTMSQHHKKHEYKKFKLKDNKSTSVTADQLAQESVRKQYRHLPFTIDHHGMIGPIATEFLFKLKNPMFHTTDTSHSNAQTSIPIQRLISTSLHPKRHKHILEKADSNWKSEYGNKWYTNTHHAQTPSQWAKQVLGNTFSIHSSKHILRAIHKSYMQNTFTSPSSRKQEKNISYCGINLQTPTQYAVRTLQFNQATA